MYYSQDLKVSSLTLGARATLDRLAEKFWVKVVDAKSHSIDTNGDSPSFLVANSHHLAHFEITSAPWADAIVGRIIFTNLASTKFWVRFTLIFWVAAATIVVFNIQ